MTGKRTTFIIFIIAIIYGLMLGMSRHPLIVDDVYPHNSCDSVLEKADILYVIPNFENDSIGDDKEWCWYVRSLNKTIGLHGITHSYHEFDNDIDEKEIALALSSFEACFGKEPELFRPPYNRISEENGEKILTLNMTVYKNRFVAHPYCHCNPKSYMKLLNWVLWC